jgi:hypothetical protein
MDKDFVLKYLKKEHLRNNAELMEIVEVKGLDYVKELLKHFETMRFLYIPTLKRNKELMKAVIADNYQKMTIRQLVMKTGLSQKSIEKIIREIEEKNGAKHNITSL